MRPTPHAVHVSDEEVRRRVRIVRPEDYPPDMGAHIAAALDEDVRYYFAGPLYATVVAITPCGWLALITHSGPLTIEHLRAALVGHRELMEAA